MLHQFVYMLYILVRTPILPMPEVRNIASERVWSSKANVFLYAPYPSSPCVNVEPHLRHLVNGLVIRFCCSANGRQEISTGGC